MDQHDAIDALSALAQDTRLDVFRRLVRAGPEGAAASAIADGLSVSRPVMSFHLAHLERTGLVAVEKRGRERIYRARFETMRALVDYLMTDCCAGLSAANPARSQKMKETTQ